LTCPSFAIQPQELFNNAQHQILADNRKRQLVQFRFELPQFSDVVLEIREAEKGVIDNRREAFMPFYVFVFEQPVNRERVDVKTRFLLPSSGFKNQRLNVQPGVYF